MNSLENLNNKIMISFKLDTIEDDKGKITKEYIDLPIELITEIEKCKDDKGVKQVGIEWAIQQSLELKSHGVPVLHYYSMGKSENIRQIANKVF